jgi:hypothetical protein
MMDLGHRSAGPHVFIHNSTVLRTFERMWCNLEGEGLRAHRQFGVLAVSEGNTAGEKDQDGSKVGVRDGDGDGDGDGGDIRGREVYRGRKVLFNVTATWDKHGASASVPGNANLRRANSPNQFGGFLSLPRSVEHEKPSENTGQRDEHTFCFALEPFPCTLLPCRDVA